VLHVRGSVSKTLVFPRFFYFYFFFVSRHCSPGELLFFILFYFYFELPLSFRGAPAEELIFYFFLFLCLLLLSFLGSSAEELIEAIKHKGYTLHILGDREGGRGGEEEGAGEREGGAGAGAGEAGEGAEAKGAGAGAGAGEAADLHLNPSFSTSGDDGAERQLNGTDFVSGRYSPLGLEWIRDYQRPSLPRGGNMIIAEFRRWDMDSCLARFRLR
jgi:hypothetical protein